MPPSYSGLRSGDEFESTSDDIGRLKSQDIGEGGVKIRCTFWRYVDNALYGDIFGEFKKCISHGSLSADYTKEEYHKVHFEEHLSPLR